MNHAVQAATNRWREGLVARGFSDDGQRMRGVVPWSGSGAGPARSRVEITAGHAFPFGPPRVVVLDPGAQLQTTFHIEADGALCLWEDVWAVDEAPWRDPDMLLRRIANWLESTAAGWPDDDSCDLERYLTQDRTMFVLYDATTLVFDAAVRTWDGPTPGTVVVSGELRKVREFRDGRRRRRDSRLAWVADIGAMDRPLRCWDDIATVLGVHAAEVIRLIRFGAVSTLLLRYLHGGTTSALALRVTSTAGGIRLAACESADTSAATLGLRAGPAAPELAGLRVAVIGCGAIGSIAADLLFRSGARHLTLADDERLRPGNLVRHRAGAEHVGRPKTEAVRACLASVAPDVARVRTRGPLLDLEDAVELVHYHQVVLDATGSARASSLLACGCPILRTQPVTCPFVCGRWPGMIRWWRCD